MKFLILAALISGHAMAAETVVRLGKVYAKGTVAKGEALFFQRTEMQTDGTVRRIKVVIKDAGQKIVMTESALFNGDVLVEQDVEQKQIRERYELRFKDGRTIYRTFKTDPSGVEHLADEKNEKTAADFLTGPGLEPFLKAQEKRLSGGETVVAAFGVFELGRSVRFEFTRIGHAPAGENINVRMAPASFWLSLLVNPIDIEVDAKTMNIVHYTGRTPLRTKVKNESKNLDADVIYTAEAVKP